MHSNTINIKSPHCVPTILELHIFNYHHKCFFIETLHIKGPTFFNCMHKKDPHFLIACIKMSTFSKSTHKNVHISKNIHKNIDILNDKHKRFTFIVQIKSSHFGILCTTYTCMHTIISIKMCTF